MSHNMTKPTKWHVPSPIGVFTVRMKKALVLSCPLNAQRRLWSDWADAQADLSLRWAQSFCWLCHKAAHISKNVIFCSLFPTMPRHNFHKVKPLVESLCKKHGVKYREKTLLGAFGDIVRYMFSKDYCAPTHLWECCPDPGGGLRGFRSTTFSPTDINTCTYECHSQLPALPVAQSSTSWAGSGSGADAFPGLFESRHAKMWLRGFATRVNTDRPAQLQRPAGVLKFWI